MFLPTLTTSEMGILSSSPIHVQRNRNISNSQLNIIFNKLYKGLANHASISTQFTAFSSLRKIAVCKEFPRLPKIDNVLGYHFSNKMLRAQIVHLWWNSVVCTVNVLYFNCIVQKFSCLWHSKRCSWYMQLKSGYALIQNIVLATQHNYKIEQVWLIR